MPTPRTGTGAALTLPYVCQWSDPAFVASIVIEGADPCLDSSCIDHGFPDADSYRFWSSKLCGMACLESVLRGRAIAHPDRWTMLGELIEAGAYVPRDDGGVDGLIYAPFAHWVGRRFGLTAEVAAPFDLDALWSVVTHGAVALASVSSEIRFPHNAPTRRGGHLVLVTGADRGDGRQQVTFHNPSGVPPHQADAHLPLDTFHAFFAERGIIIT